MKKSELKQFIREEIISTLSEAEQGIIHTKDQNKAVELAKKGLNVSIDENLNPEVTKAVERFIKAMAKKYGYGEQDAIFAITSALNKMKSSTNIDEKKKSEDEDEDVEVKDDWNKVEKEDSFVEKEPSAKDLKKGDKVTKMAAKLAMVTKEMKSVVSQWKKAEGSEKDRLLNRLKELTKVKKELDAFITPTIGTDED
jgi:hypothetical protein